MTYQIIPGVLSKLGLLLVITLILILGSRVTYANELANLIELQQAHEDAFLSISRTTDQSRGGNFEGLVFDGKLYFFAKDKAHGEELWVTDGTPEGTRLFLDLLPGKGGVGSDDLVKTKSHIFVNVRGNVWISDGTIEGTVKQSAPGINIFTGIVAMGDKAYYQEPQDGFVQEISKQGVRSLGFRGVISRDANCVTDSETSMVFTATTAAGSDWLGVFDGEKVTPVDRPNDDTFVQSILGQAGNSCYVLLKEAVGPSVFQYRLARVSNSGALEITNTVFSRKDSIAVAGFRRDAIVFHGTDQGGLHILRNNSSLTSIIDLQASVSIGTRMAPGIFVDDSFWYRSGGEYRRYDFQTGLVTKLNLPNEIESIGMLNGDVLISTSSGDIYATNSTSSVLKKILTISPEAVILPSLPKFDYAPELDDPNSEKNQLLLPISGNSATAGGLWALRESGVIHEHLSGDWVADSLKDQGLMLFSVTPENAEDFLFAAWFTYLEGAPFWLAGNASYSGAQNSIVLPLVRLSGLEFLNPDPNSIANREIVGELTLEALGCNYLNVIYDLGALGSGSVEMKPLFLLDEYPLCQSSN